MTDKRNVCRSCRAHPTYAHSIFCETCDKLRRAAKLALQIKAKNIVGHAVKNGGLPKVATQLCADCGNRASGYDHRNYSMPLEVEPVCHPCNIRRGMAADLAAAYTLIAEQASS